MYTVYCIHCLQSNVCGDHCDECSEGFYNLQESNPNGCDPCFCFGISQACTSSAWGRDTVRHRKTMLSVTV